MHHIDASFGGFEIDIVETSAAQCDEFHPIFHQFIDNLSVAFCIDEDAHYVCTLSEGNSFERKVLFVVLDIETVVSIGCCERRFVVRMTVEKCNFKCHNK